MYVYQHLGMETKLQGNLCTKAVPIQETIAYPMLGKRENHRLKNALGMGYLSS